MPPLELASKLPLLSNILTECHTAWISDPVTGFSIPFALGLHYSQLLQEVRAGRMKIADLPAIVRANLLLAGIIIKQGFLIERQKEWASIISQANTYFKKERYAILLDLFPPLLIGALRTHYRQLIQEGQYALGDGQCSLRYGIYNEDITNFFHQQLVGLISYVVGAPVKPSYTYVGVYQGGAELLRHTDRNQCEYTLSICIDYTPEPEKETPWPIYVETPEGEIATFQSMGDGLLFKGRELPHYRHKLEEGSTSTSIFLHYVDIDFQGSLT
jgi:hypothetical protein